MLSPSPSKGMANDAIQDGTLPVLHRITQEWETYDFSHAFLRTTTLFNYMDLAAGRDTVIFGMDERFYQLTSPEIYIDARMGGQSKRTDSRL